MERINHRSSMISVSHVDFSITCDNCGKKYEFYPRDAEPDFPWDMSAVRAKGMQMVKNQGWWNEKVEGEWRNYCDKFNGVECV